MDNFLAIAIIVLGLVVLAVGSRLVVLGAAVGALLGLVILRFIPGAQTGLLAWLIPIILAVIFAFGGGFMKGIVGLVTMAIGAVAGAAIVLGVMDLFSLSFGLIDWIIALVGAVIGVVLVQRFKDWAVIALAALVGALLVTRGLQALVPALQGAIGTVVLIVLAAGGFAYQGGFVGGKKHEVK